MIRTSRIPSHRRGFSLLELSIVLIISAVLVTMGIGMSLNSVKAADRVVTQERLATIKQALEAYVKMNGYLPCPANRAQTSAAHPTTFGREIRPCAASAPGIVRIVSNTIDIGAVPVRSLGLPDAYAADAWGNKFTYAVSVALETAYASADPAISIFRGDRFATNYNTTSATNRATIPSVAGSLAPGAGASYVVVSHGPDKRGAYPLRGTTIVYACSTGNQNDSENCDDGNATFWETAYNDTGSNVNKYYDDYIVWGSNALERANISTAATTCTGSCEAWCAPCGGTTAELPTVGVAAFTAGTPVLCKKFITSTSPCQATCLWAGTLTSGTKAVRCP